MSQNTLIGNSLPQATHYPLARPVSAIRLNHVLPCLSQRVHKVPIELALIQCELTYDISCHYSMAFRQDAILPLHSNDTKAYPSRSPEQLNNSYRGNTSWVIKRFILCQALPVILLIVGLSLGLHAYSDFPALTSARMLSTSTQGGGVGYSDLMERELIVERQSSELSDGRSTSPASTPNSSRDCFDPGYIPGRFHGPPICLLSMCLPWWKNCS